MTRLDLPPKSKRGSSKLPVCKSWYILWLLSFLFHNHHSSLCTPGTGTLILSRIQSMYHAFGPSLTSIFYQPLATRWLFHLATFSCSRYATSHSQVHLNALLAHFSHQIYKQGISVVSKCTFPICGSTIRLRGSWAGVNHTRLSKLLHMHQSHRTIEVVALEFIPSRSLTFHLYNEFE